MILSKSKKVSSDPPILPFVIGVRKWARVGSEAVGAPSPADRDFICFGDYGIIIAALLDLDFDSDAPEAYARSNDFTSMRRGNDNVIVIRDEVEYYAFLAATHLCKKYKVFDKEDRVAIHEAFRAGMRMQCDVDVNTNTREETIRGYKEARRFLRGE
jgi:hypothetical protein